MLGCSCRAPAHRRCMEAWTKHKGDRTCELCGKTMTSLPEPPPRPDATSPRPGDRPCRARRRRRSRRIDAHLARGFPPAVAAPGAPYARIPPARFSDPRRGVTSPRVIVPPRTAPTTTSSRKPTAPPPPRMPPPPPPRHPPPRPTISTSTSTWTRSSRWWRAPRLTTWSVASPPRPVGTCTRPRASPRWSPTPPTRSAPPTYRADVVATTGTISPTVRDSASRTASRIARRSPSSKISLACERWWPEYLSVLNQRELDLIDCFGIVAAEGHAEARVEVRYAGSRVEVRYAGSQGIP